MNLCAAPEKGKTFPSIFALNTFLACSLFPSTVLSARDKRQVCSLPGEHSGLQGSFYGVWWERGKTDEETLLGADKESRCVSAGSSSKSL